MIPLESKESNAGLDLERLKIDRRPRARGRQGSKPGRRWARLAFLAAGAALLWTFRAPLLGTLDLLRLPVVEVAAAVKPSPAAGGAVSGVAANGHVVGRTRAALSSDIPGRIVEINVREGELVKKGFVVARLHCEEQAAALRRAEADLLAAQAALRRARAEEGAMEAELMELEAGRQAAAATQAEKEAGERLAALDHDRVRKLAASGLDSRQREDEARAELEAARARAAAARSQVAAADAALQRGRSKVELAAAAIEEALARIQVLAAARDVARAALEKTEIKAPFDGVVVLKDAEAGEVLSPHSQAGASARGSVATLVDFASLEAQAEVPETSLAAVKAGAPVRIFLDAYPDRAYRGRVDRIWPTANRQKATVEVRAVFEERDDRLRPEMGLRVVFLEPSGENGPHSNEAAPALPLIPEDALVRVDAADAVFVLERDVARLRPVNVAGRRGGRAAVSNGLAGDERVIRRPPAGLGDGDRVRERG